MKGNQALNQALSALLDAQDALKDLEIASCLLTALENEIGELVGIKPEDPCRVCERAGFLLDTFRRQVFDQAMGKLENNLGVAQFYLLAKQDVTNVGD
jgi:hypothetical protein